jgi:hypothetical protein
MDSRLHAGRFQDDLRRQCNPEIKIIFFMARQSDMFPLPGTVKNKTVPNNGNFFYRWNDLYNKEENQIYYLCDIFFKNFLPLFSQMFVMQGLFQFMTHADACA